MALLLMSLIGGLVVPRLGTLFQSLQVREQRDQLLLQIEGLPYLAHQNGEAYRVDRDVLARAGFMEDMEDWQLFSEQTIVVHASGVCSGGYLELQHKNGLSWSYELLPPYCRPREIVDEDP